jgi:hypothetical protein
MTFNTDFDERYFINLNGLSRTPLKLINSMSPHRKSPPSKGDNSSNGTFKRPKKDIDLSFGSNDQHFAAFVDKENKEDTAFGQALQMIQPPRQAMQRKLNFTSSLNEISLRQSLQMN